jgi:hypothetical protein
MREPFAHEAVLTIEEGGDVRAPGAAITVALCGHWDHEPPCPLAPHDTSAQRIDDRVHLRTLFAVEPALEDVVRQRICSALDQGRLTGPDGRTTQWHLRDGGPSPVRPDEAERARRLVAERS